MICLGPSCSRCVGGQFKCPCCASACIKYGQDKRGKQRYYCKSCHKTFVGHYSYRAYDSHTTKNIVNLLCKGTGIRSISVLLGISPTTTLRRIAKASKETVKPAIAANANYEVDELRTYIGNKKKLIWVVCALNRQTRHIVDFRVGPRNNKTLRQVIETLKLAKAKRIHTDGLRNYRYLIPGTLHEVKQHGINLIERQNLNIRLFLKRFNRKTICYSKSAAMIEHCLRLYLWRDRSIFGG